MAERVKQHFTVIAKLTETDENGGISYHELDVIEYRFTSKEDAIATLHTLEVGAEFYRAVKITPVSKVKIR